MILSCRKSKGLKPSKLERSPLKATLAPELDPCLSLEHQVFWTALTAAMSLSSSRPSLLVLCLTLLPFLKLLVTTSLLTLLLLGQPRPLSLLGDCEIPRYFSSAQNSGSSGSLGSGHVSQGFFLPHFSETSSPLSLLQ